MPRINNKNNINFFKNNELNNLTYLAYLENFEKLAMSIFEWVNLPKSMNSIYLEYALYYDGMASLLFDENLGFINTRCASNGYLNLYNIPTKLNCYSYDFQSLRNTYTGLNNHNVKQTDCILVQNNWNRTPTFSQMQLFAYRLFEIQRTADVNISAQRTPVLILIDEKQRLTLENLYSKYEGNMPVIFGDKNNLDTKNITALNTGAPFLYDKIMDCKKEIWNEALTCLGINNINVDKKERLITDEANNNNELINLNLQSFLIPRQKACEQFNQLFGLVDTDKEISVRVRSDLKNIIKTFNSSVSELNNGGDTNWQNIQ